MTGTSLIDLVEAFDTVDQKRLLKKIMPFLFFPDGSVKWEKSHVTTAFIRIL